ncbi:MAG: hypothetical protein ACOC5T_09910, partial [Elusimicrobiota bacterium]
HKHTQKSFIYNESNEIVKDVVTAFDQWGNATFDEVTLHKEASERTAHDPWTKGELKMVDGHLALVVDPDDVKGKSFYQFDPNKLTGETKKDKDGNYIFMVGVDDGKTKQELKNLIGSKVNLMWQYYSKTDVENSFGYGWIWLAPTSDRRVATHLKNDSKSRVEQWGGDWDNSKQYVVID